MVAHSPFADDEALCGACDEDTATVDLSGSKHEDFVASSDAPGRRHALPQLALTIL
jgi:hypothetical protein